MVQLGAEYPLYNLQQHKGYCVPEHVAALQVGSGEWSYDPMILNTMQECIHDLMCAGARSGAAVRARSGSPQPLLACIARACACSLGCPAPQRHGPCAIHRRSFEPVKVRGASWTSAP